MKCRMSLDSLLAEFNIKVYKIVLLLDNLG